MRLTLHHNIRQQGTIGDSQEVAQAYCLHETASFTAGLPSIALLQAHTYSAARAHLTGSRYATINIGRTAKAHHQGKLADSSYTSMILTSLVLLAQETERLVADSPPGISAVPHDDNLRYFDVVIDGPSDSAFEGGKFKLELFLPEEYPMGAPKVRLV